MCPSPLVSWVLSQLRCKLLPGSPFVNQSLAAHSPEENKAGGMHMGKQTARRECDLPHGGGKDRSGRGEVVVTNAGGAKQASRASSHHSLMVCPGLGSLKLPQC